VSSLIRLELDLVPLPSSNSILPLEYLYLGGVEAPLQLAEFLEKTPYLKTLRVSWYASGPTGGPLVLKPQVVPQLTDLGARWSLCAQILPGRPISRLEVSQITGKLGRNEVKILAMSTEPLVQLSIPNSFYLNVPFWEHFPHLRDLEIWSMNCDHEAWGEVCFFLFSNVFN
jgi:hypothetical protein